jgi:hypothetical protein
MGGGTCDSELGSLQEESKGYIGALGQIWLCFVSFTGC